MLPRHFSLTLLALLTLASLVCVTVGEETEKKKKKKDIRDYTDADLEKLYEQWEEQDDDPLEEDELPEHKRKPPPIDFSKADMGDPEAMLKMSKKGRSLMAFVSVSGKPTRKETEEITQLWQSSLYNAHIDLNRYVVDDDRAIFMFTDGSKAWEAKAYLVEQPRCAGVTIEGKVYDGKGATNKNTEL